MTKAPLPDNEAGRLEALRRYNILDTLPERDFDDLVRTAAQICGTPITLVTLVDAERQWFKAKVGVTATHSSRDIAFCAHAILGSDLLIVRDATADERFLTNPFVTGPPHIRFYAGAPLMTPDGHALGTLCVIDRVPRDLIPEQVEGLRALSRQIVAQLELRKARADLTQTTAAREATAAALRASEELKTRMIESSQDCIKVLDLDGRLLSMNAGGMRTLEICDFTPLVNSPWIEFWQGEGREAARAAVAAARSGGVGRFTGYCPTMTGKPMWWDVVVNAILDAEGRPERLLAVSREVTEQKRAAEMLRAIVEGTASVTGRDFFSSLVRHLASALQVRHAFLTECPEGTQGRARMLAFWKGDGFGENIEYDVAPTPCMAVLEGKTRHHPVNLQALFPDDKDLVDLAAESYLGVPLLDASGRVIGHLAVLDHKPMEEVSREVSLLSVFAARAGAELERLKAEDKVRASLAEVETLNMRIAAAAARSRALLEVNNAIISNLTPEALFHAIAEALRRVVPFDRSAMFLHDPQKDVLRLFILQSSLPSAYFTVGLEVPPGDSHVGWVFQHRRPLLRRDLETEREYPLEDRAFADGVRSYVIVPLIARGTSVGALAVASTTPNQYAESDATFLQETASQVALAVENMKAYEDITALNVRVAETAARHRTLLEINNAIISNLTQEALFFAIAQALRRVVPLDRIAIFLHDSQKDVLRLSVQESSLPVGGHVVGLEWAIGESHGGWAFAHQRPLLRKDLETERHFPTEDLLLAEGVRSLLVVPLIARGKSIGTLNLNSAAPNRYSESDVAFLQEVASQVTLAVENMKAYEEIAALKARLEQENVYLQEEIRTQHNFEEIVGSAPPLLEALRKVEKVASTDATVLILGETGTGKELFARAIHSRSVRKGRPLVKVNCGVIPAGLVESELFGHVKGAFTGALQSRTGRFELANGGTLFLDEVGELPPETQVKLLRVLQEQEFEPVGSSRTIRVNVRVIAATNRNLEEAVRAGRFRTDLLYRLNVFPIAIPPLRERTSDIPLLVGFYLTGLARRLGKPLTGFSRKSMERLIGYPWPGNVRELQNFVERAAILAPGPVLELETGLLPQAQARGPGAESPRTLEDLSRSHILNVLRTTRGVVEGPRGAAKLLGLHPNTLRSRMKKLSIERSHHDIS